MFKLIAATFILIILYGMLKYQISKRILKEDADVLNAKYNRHGPFFKIDWEKNNE